jgi:dGTPase
MAELPLNLLRGGERWRASYASDPSASRGRVHAEPEDGLRSSFQRDRDRIIHSNAFRRLKHKTQVFIHHEGDHFRTRLTHSLEVAQIARSIARPLGLDEDLAEALALAHDLGHPPFGHAGERALDRALEEFGGFDHNAQSLRVVTALERRYPLFDGLNLTWETLEGLVKHNGPLTDHAGRPIGPHEGGPLPDPIRELDARMDLQLQAFPGLEAQAAAIADDVAYDCHDLEDGLRASLLDVDDLESRLLTGSLVGDIRREYPGLETPRLVHELIRRAITTMIRDVLAETAARIETGGVRTGEDVRAFGRAIVGFSPELAVAERQLKRFLLDSVYRHDQIMRSVAAAEGIVADLFDAYRSNPELMPEDWSRDLGTLSPPEQARRVADYIAGMTDRFSLSEYRRLFDRTTDLG